MHSYQITKLLTFENIDQADNVYHERLLARAAVAEIPPVPPSEIIGGHLKIINIILGDT